jgi:hypothetical protein
MPTRVRYGGTLNCHVPEKTRQAVQKVADIKNATLSEVVRDLLDEALTARGLE